MKKIQAPSFSEELQAQSVGILEEYRYDDLAFCDEETEVDYVQKEFYECRFTNVHLTGRMHACLFADVIFEECDLSNCDLRECVFHRCIFKKCRLTGIDLSFGTFCDVVFQHCQCAYANLNGTKWERCLLDSCMFRESAIHELKWKDLNIHACDLTGSEFFHTKLAGLDLSDSNIEGITVELKDLRGLIVNSMQAVSLSQLLGLIINE